jgi:hypothetical protein
MPCHETQSFIFQMGHSIKSQPFGGAETTHSLKF